MNNELVNIYTWLSANKVSLNIGKSSFVIFHPTQRKLPFNVTCPINLKWHKLKPEYSIKYLVIVAAAASAVVVTVVVIVALCTLLFAQGFSH